MQEYEEREAVKDEQVKILRLENIKTEARVKELAEQLQKKVLSCVSCRSYEFFSSLNVSFLGALKCWVTPLAPSYAADMQPRALAVRAALLLIVCEANLLAVWNVADEEAPSASASFPLPWG